MLEVRIAVFCGSETSAYQLAIQHGAIHSLYAFDRVLLLDKVDIPGRGKGLGARCQSQATKAGRIARNRILRLQCLVCDYMHRICAKGRLIAGK
jgi:hypothetical protein